LTQDTDTYRCGLIAILGRPNVGKSTLLNRLIGQKVSITAHRPQTTRHRILGVKTTPAAQLVYVDTPGLHRSRKRAMNRYLNRTAAAGLDAADVVVMVCAGTRWTEEDDLVLGLLDEVRVPVILVVNKVDLVKDKASLLPHLETLSGKRGFAALVPLSAHTGDNLDALEAEIVPRLPVSPPLFPDDQLTDRSERFLAAEIVREKLTRRLGQEVPHALTCEVEHFREEGGVLHIHILIWVERPGQKAIVIGKDGAILKQVGAQAREDMQRLFARKVFLQLWVRVKEGWSDDERALKSLGYE
jgi:GTP-binding protein Era